MGGRRGEAGAEPFECSEADADDEGWRRGDAGAEPFECTDEEDDDEGWRRGEADAWAEWLPAGCGRRGDCAGLDAMDETAERGAGTAKRPPAVADDLTCSDWRPNRDGGMRECD